MDEPIVDTKGWWWIFFYAFVMGGVSLSAVYVSHEVLHPAENWNTALCNNVLFFSLIFSQLFHVWNMGKSASFFNSEIMRNKYVWYAVFISLCCLVGIYCIIPLRTVLSVYELSMYDWAVSVTAGLLSVFIIQLTKKMNRI